MSKSRKIIIIVLASLVFVFSVIAIKATEIKYEKILNNQYLKTVTVYEVHPLNEFVILEDESGNLWMIDPENEEFKVKEVCSVLFNSMGTEDIEDDEIVLIQKSEITIN